MLPKKHKQIQKQKNSCLTCATMQTTIMNCFINTKKVTAIDYCSSVICAIKRTINGSRYKNTRRFISKCQFIIVTYLTILIEIKMLKKHIMSKDKQPSSKCIMCNNTIYVSFFTAYLQEKPHK